MKHTHRGPHKNAIIATPLRHIRTALRILVGVCACLSPGWVWAQEGAPRVHFRWSQETPPGLIGQDQLRRRAVPVGAFQPVRVMGPPGLRVGVRGADAPSEVVLDSPADFALMVGALYRVRFEGIPGRPGIALYPSIEVLDRLHPPKGTEGRHPIPLHVTQEDLDLASEGRLVTKVIYLEQPDLAAPEEAPAGELPVYDVTSDQDAVESADVLGRPVAILRMGGWVPLAPNGSDDPLGPTPPVVFPISQRPAGSTEAATVAGARVQQPTVNPLATRAPRRSGTASARRPGSSGFSAITRSPTPAASRGSTATSLHAAAAGRSEVGWVASKRRTKHGSAVVAVPQRRTHQDRGWRAVQPSQSPSSVLSLSGDRR